MSRSLALVAARRRFAALFACSTLAMSCGHDVDPDYSNPEPATTPYAGLYTPGSTIGVVPGVDAGAMADPNGVTSMLMQVNGDRCVGTTGEPGTPCMLTVDFSTQVIGEHWQPANVGAVWIEQQDDAKADADQVFVKTLERWAAVRSRSLYVWGARACQVWPEPDALSRATLADHSMPHHATWDGKDLKGHIVPDGKYKLYIEVTETETNFGPLATYEFSKGSMEQSLEPPDETAVKGLKIVYTPSK